MNIDLSPLWDARQFLLQALWTTVAFSLASMALGVLIGLAVGTLRTYGPRALDMVLGFYVASARAILVSVILVSTCFAYPMLIGTSANAFTARAVALGFPLGAY